MGRGRRQRQTTPVCTVTNAAPFWTPTTLGCTDDLAPKGQPVKYRVIASDSYGNTNTGSEVVFTTSRLK